MKRPREALPKVTPPRLGRVIRRARVAQALLDAAKAGTAWVQAAAGSGKTTAVAALAEELGKPVAWVHLDAGDGEIAGFLHFLRLAFARALPKAAASLPIYAGAKGGDPLLQARRFAQAALESGPAGGAVLVLDNLHDIAPESPVHAIIAALCEEISPAWPLFLVSRDAPRKDYARLLGQGRLAIVPPATFAFSKAEIKEALRERGILVEERLEALWQKSQGWIAGALLLAMQDDGTDAPALDAGTDPAIVFGYFATQALARLSPEDRRLLVRTAFLGHIAPDSAARLSGLADAGKRLEALAANGLFTTRTTGSPPAYRYHDLFRDFLRAEARDGLDATALAALKRESAAERIAAGEPLEALELLFECGAWDAFREAVAANAERLLNQGHFQSLSALLQRVPEAQRDADPWLLYWLGQCQLGISDDVAATLLKRAYAIFERQGDRAGQLASASSVPAAIMNQLSASAEHDLWMQRIESLAGEVERLPSAYLRLLVVAGLVDGVNGNETLEARTDELVARLLELVPQVEDANLRLQALNHVIATAWRIRRRDIAPPVIAMADAMRLEELASPLIVLHWCYNLITYECMFGDHERARRYGDRAEKIAEETGLPHARFEAILVRTEIAGDGNLIPEIKALLARLEKTADPSRPFARAAVHGIRGRIALLEGDGALAESEALRAHEILDLAQWPRAFRTAYFMVEVGGLATQGRYEAALERCERYRPDFKRRFHAIIDMYAAWVRAAMAVDRGAPEARDALRAAVASARACNSEYPLRHANPLTARLCAQALAWGIEPAYVAGIVARRRLVPPAGATDAWPYPIRVRCLGGFEVRRAGEPAAAARAQKPLDLLQFAISHGGASVPVDHAIRALWPGEGRVGAQQAFDTTLHRLRKMLGSDTAVTAVDRQLAIDPNEAWVDARALETRLDTVEAGDGGDGAPGTALAAVFSLYGGHFLPHREEPWARDARQRLWGRVRRVLLAAAQRARDAQADESAERILYFIVDHDPLAEDAFAALMRLNLERGQPAEALRAYQRCAAALEAELGVAPGEEMRRLEARVRQL